MTNLAHQLRPEGILDFDIDSEFLAELNQTLEAMPVIKRVEWALDNLPSNHMLSSSFGAQSAVMLHLMIRWCRV